MDVKLIVTTKAGKTQKFRLKGEETVIGRRQGSGLRVPSETVSRRHCRLIVRDDTVTVEDLASINGTFVNGKRISAKQPLHPGDRLTVGAVTFVVQYQLSQAAIDRLLAEGAASPVVVDDEPALVPEAPVVLDDLEVLEPLAEEHATVNFDTPKKKPRKPPKPKKPAKKQKPERDDAEADEQNPDASELLGGRGPWEMPAGDDIRDILSQLEEE